MAFLISGGRSISLMYEWPLAIILHLRSMGHDSVCCNNLLWVSPDQTGQLRGIGFQSSSNCSLSALACSMSAMIACFARWSSNGWIKENTLAALLRSVCIAKIGEDAHDTVGTSDASDQVVCRGKYHIKKYIFWRIWHFAKIKVYSAGVFDAWVDLQKYLATIDDSDMRRFRDSSDFLQTRLRDFHNFFINWHNFHISIQNVFIVYKMSFLLQVIIGSGYQVPLYQNKKVLS